MATTLTFSMDDPQIAVPGAEIDAPGDMASRAAALEDQMRTITTRLQGLADDQITRKAETEKRWLEDLRAFHGKYDADTEKALRDQRRSRAFVKITRKKTNAWQARLQELLFPTDDRNWGIRPTPVPKLGKQAEAAVQKAKDMVAKANAAPDPAQAAQHAQEGDTAAQQAGSINDAMEEAKKRSDAMQDEMDDQLVECQYAAECRDVIQDAVRLGTGILKGPLAGDQSRGSWAQGPDGQHMYQRETDPRPIYKRVDPWSYFPDDGGEYDLERHLWTKKDLRRLVRENAFNAAAVRRLLLQDRSGPLAAPGLSYLAELRSINAEGDSLRGRYVGWEYHGTLECSEIVIVMRSMALTLPPEQMVAAMQEADAYEAADDPLEERRVIMYFCEGEVLKIVPEYVLDSGESLYSIFPFEPGEASVFGYGVPNIMGDSQRALNGAWRAAIDNMALSVGPQIVFDKDGVEPQDGSWFLTPRKVWLRKKSSGTTAAAPFEAINIPNNINEIITIVREARQHADDEVAMPVMSEGEQPESADQTATAVRAISAGSNVTFRRIVKAFDDGITTPSMRRLYDWNMQFNPRDDIKGDMSIDARGTSVLMVREIQSQVLMAIVQGWATNPALAPMMKLYQAARRTLQSMMISPDDVLVSEAEYKANIEAAQKAQEQGDPNDPKLIEVQTRLQIAQVNAKSALEVATIQQTTELTKMAEMRNMSVEELKADITKAAMVNQTKQSIEQLKQDGKERIFAGEIGIEQQNAREARARGEAPKGSGGYVSE